MLDVSIWRGGDQGKLDRFQVPARQDQTVLDVVTWVQRHRAPALAYRFACRVGVCGSCAMTVNGRPRWTCRSHVRKVAPDGRLTIEPLRNLPRIKDLVCDLTPFFERWQKAGGRFRGNRDRHAALAQISPDDRQRRAADAGIECINCAVCHSACDVVGWKPGYLGPAALNRAWTLVNDTRHAERAETLERTTGEGGCHSCHGMASCTRHCPVGIEPSASIAGLKRQSTITLLKGGA